MNVISINSRSRQADPVEIHNAGKRAATSVKLRDSTRAEKIENAVMIIVGIAVSIVGWIVVGEAVWELAVSLWR
jgi:hypothetical protein